MGVQAAGFGPPGRCWPALYALNSPRGFIDSAEMSSGNYRIRRATLDDIEPLTALWGSMHFQPEQLAKQVTEFQLAEDGDGKLLGAVGLQLMERQGLIHSEGFTDFALAEPLRPLLLERIRTLATNHGLLRLWTREQAPFWARSGLQKADAEALKLLPAAWGEPNAKWITLKLKDDVEALLAADREFAMFMEAEKARTARALQQARILKFVATLLALVLLGIVLAGTFVIFRHNPQFIRH